MVIFFDFSTVEKLIVEAVKYNYVQMKVDHLKEVVNFGSQVNALQLNEFLFEKMTSSQVRLFRIHLVPVASSASSLYFLVG